MKIILTIFAAAIICGCAKKQETAGDKTKRWRHEYETALAQVITNEIVGLKAYRMDLMDAQDDPTNWAAIVSADYVNHIGGIDRTNFFVKASTNALATFTDQCNNGDIHYGAMFQTMKDATGADL